MKIDDILARLLHEVALLVANGQLTERRLARLIGISQPHIHHILKGKRRITPQVADLILDALNMDVRQLMEDGPGVTLRGENRLPDEIAIRIPLLQGLLGPEDPEPSLSEVALHFPFPLSLLDGEKNCVAVRLGRDALLTNSVQEGDIAIVSVSTTSTVAAQHGIVYAFRGTWVLDIPANPFADLRSRQGQLQTREALLRREGSRIGRVLWLLRGLKHFVPTEWDGSE